MCKHISETHKIKLPFYVAFKEQLENRSVERVKHQETHTGDSAVGKVLCWGVKRDRIF